MFNGKFKEGQELSTVLEEIDGVVSSRSLQMLVQWVCLGRTIFNESLSDKRITTVNLLDLQICALSLAWSSS